MNQSKEKPVFLAIWGIFCALVFLVQSVIESSAAISTLLPGFPDLTGLTGFITWRGDFLAAFAALLILVVFAAGVVQILMKNEPATGVAFIIIGAGLATVMGVLFLSINLADLLGSLVGTLGEEPAPFEWTFTLFGSIITWLITLPSFYGINYVKEATRGKT